MSKNSNGESSIYKGADGSWHGRVTMGVKDNGKPDRRHRRGKTRAEVVKKVRELEKQRDQGTAPKVGQRYRVHAWLTYWVENIACPPNVSENAHSGYEVDVRVHLNPGIGEHWLDKLTPEHLEKLYAKMMKGGTPKPGRGGWLTKEPSSAGTVHHVHRTVRNALNEAKKRGHIPQNPALLAKAPRLDDDEAEPYTVAEVRRLLALVADRRNGPRWVIALALGLRQGEALGLKWEHVDLDTGLARIRRNRLRPKYKHGCGGTCGRKMAGYCPNREQTRPDTGPTKSRAGRHVVGLPDPLIVLLKTHKEAQEAERAAARQLWHDEGWVFATPEGRPLNPSTDYHEWKDLLDEAGLPERRLHDARHTAATVLAILAVPTPTAMAIMGWSSAEMAARYQHVLDSIRKGVADQVAGLLWGTTDDGPVDRDSQHDDGNASASRDRE
jgi:integrase